MRRQAVACAALALVASCTFGNMGSYDIQTCDPSRPYYADECTVGLDPPPCQTYVCSRTTNRCVLGPLDFDRDGDPPLYCGGHDCDDTNPSTSSSSREICDGKDNDCNGLIDDGLLQDVGATGFDVPPLAASADVSIARVVGGDELFATFVAMPSTRGAGPCIATSEDSTSGFPLACNAYGAAVERDPRQPSTLVTADSGGRLLFSTAYVTGAACDSLGFVQSDGTAIELACDGHVSLPSVGNIVDTSQTFVAYFDSPISDGVDAADCSGDKPASLYVRSVVTSGAGVPTLSPPFLLSSRSHAVRAAAIPGADNDYGPQVVIAPDGGAVSFFGLVAGPTGTLSLGSIGVLPHLQGATSVAVAFMRHAQDTSFEAVRFAAVAEIGCPPTTNLRIAFGSIVGANGSAWSLYDEHAVDAIPAGAPAGWAPAISWTDDGTYSEWRATWMSENGPMLRRFVGPDGALPEGTPIGPPIPLWRVGVSVRAAPAPDGHVLTVDQGAPHGINRHPIRCVP